MRQKRITNSNQTPREFFDFFVDSVSLKSILGAENADFISPFGWLDKKYERQVIEEFRLKNKPELSSGRTMIYICPECGDIECGAITVKISKLDNKIIWSDFAFESGNKIDHKDFENINEISFDKHAYFHAFDSVI